jgi:AcrR family transcriptional regulator
LATRSNPDVTASHSDALTKRGVEREAEILRVAGEIFFERGYQATTMIDIANAVGLLKGSLYHYLTSKEELLFRVIYDAHKDSLEATQLKLIGLSAVEAIRAYIVESVTFVALHPAKSAVFYAEYRHLTGDHLDKILALRNENENMLRTLMRRGQADGVVRRDLDARLLALHVIGSITAMPNWYKPDGSWSPTFIADAYADLALASLLVDSWQPR